ncbi:MAG: glycosyltransferase [Lapillicoccus sp.]
MSLDHHLGLTDVDHVVLTRFNVRMDTYEHPPTGWLDGRIDLFEQYCLPSVRAQTTQGFTWLLFFDSETPTESLARMRALAEDGLFDVVLVEGQFTRARAAEHVQSRARAPFLITTRVDNDDAVATDFIQTVQAQFGRQDLEFVNLVDGAQLWEGRTYLRPYTKNPFVSLVERRTDRPPHTVFISRHFAVDETGPVLNVRTRHPMWLQVVHGGNVLNEIVGLRSRGSAVTPWFGCHLETTDAGLHRDRLRGGIRIVVRLVSQPHRIVELLRARLAKRARS